MDSKLRALAREAVTDPSVKERLLRQRVRSGAISQDALNLAAYCGHPLSQEVIGGFSYVKYPGYGPGVGVKLSEWLYGLQRHFDHETRVRAAVLAARVMYSCVVVSHEDDEAIQAAEHCLDHYNEVKHVCWEFKREAIQARSMWAIGPIREIIWSGGHTAQGAYWREGIKSAVSRSSVGTIFGAIRVGLIHWALDGH